MDNQSKIYVRCQKWGLMIIVTSLFLVTFSFVLMGYLWLDVSFKLAEGDTASLGTVSSHDSESKGYLDEDTKRNLYAARGRLVSKSLFYERHINERMLKSGMVANRMLDDGSPQSLCDSLLFSSLRFAALKMLGFQTTADLAWNAILLSRKGDRWIRHPECAEQPTSRDMMAGLVIALTQKPSGYRDTLHLLLKQLNRDRGYASSGPFYVSFVAPHFGDVLRQLSELESLSKKDWPWIVKKGFSTVEFSALFNQRGYEAHLSALSIWTELEIMRLSAGGDRPVAAKSLFDIVFGPSSLGAAKFSKGRLAWAAKRLLTIDEINLFFRFLASKFDTRESVQERARTLLSFSTELLDKNAFPGFRLPLDCDRKADYLWQRDSKEYKPKIGVGVGTNPSCEEEYSGVDFLWMAALIVRDIDELAPYSNDVERDKSDKKDIEEPGEF